MKIDARLLVRLYPRQWRERYGEELRAMIDESGAPGARACLDLMAGAIRERLRATFITPSPKLRQYSLRLFVHFGSWIVGSILATAIAVILPDVGKPSAFRETLVFGGLFASFGIFVYVSMWRDDMPTGLVKGIRPLTGGLAALVVLLALASTVAADLGQAHAYRIGLDTLNDVFLNSGARGLAFGPIGVGIAGMFWPDRFRDLDVDPPRPSSTLGLSA